MINKIALRRYNFLILLLGYFTPPIVLILFINFFSVNVPFWDQWNLVPLFKKVSLGTATFQDFFAQHNEHRIFFPRLIITPLAFASHWNIKYELAVNFILSLITFLLLCSLSIREINAGEKNIHLANIITSIFIFSLVQYENWLWGFQIAWFLINLCLVSCIFCLSSGGGFIRLRFSLAALFCVIASFSSVHGLLVWIAAIPSLIIFSANLPKRERIICFWAWFSMSVISLIVYFWGYQKPVNHPDIFFFLHHPFIAIKYFLNLLSSPINPKFSPSILGLIIFSTFIFLVIFWVKQSGSKFFKDAAPYISLGLYTILFDLITTIGRSGFGVDQARASRYTTISILLIIAIIQLLRLVLSHHLKQHSSSPANWSLGYMAICGALSFLVLTTSINSYAAAKNLSLRMKSGQSCLELVNLIKQLPDQSCLKSLYPDTEKIIVFSKDLAKLGFR